MSLRAKRRRERGGGGVSDSPIESEWRSIHRICKLHFALSSEIDLRRDRHMVEHLYVVGNKSAWQRVYRKEEWYSNAFGSVYAASWRPKGCVASEICHPDVNQYFVGFVRAPPNQPSVQPLLPSPVSLYPPTCPRLFASLFFSFAYVIASCVRVNWPGGICRIACAITTNSRTDNKSLFSLWKRLIF